MYIYTAVSNDLGQAKNKGTYITCSIVAAHSHRLINPFVFCCIDSNIEIRSFFLVSFTVQAVLRLTQLKTPEIDFLATRLKESCADDSVVRPAKQTRISDDSVVRPAKQTRVYLMLLEIWKDHFSEFAIATNTEAANITS